MQDEEPQGIPGRLALWANVLHGKVSASSYIGLVQRVLRRGVEKEIVDV